MVRRPRPKPLLYPLAQLLHGVAVLAGRLNGRVDYGVEVRPGRIGSVVRADR